MAVSILALHGRVFMRGRKKFLGSNVDPVSAGLATGAACLAVAGSHCVYPAGMARLAR